LQLRLECANCNRDSQLLAQLTDDFVKIMLRFFKIEFCEHVLKISEIYELNMIYD